MIDTIVQEFRRQFLDGDDMIVQDGDTVPNTFSYVGAALIEEFIVGPNDACVAMFELITTCEPLDWYVKPDEPSWVETVRSMVHRVVQRALEGDETLEAESLRRNELEIIIGEHPEYDDPENDG